MFSQLDLLDCVLWNESRTKDCAERIWNAVNLPEYSLPHVGVNTLDETIGYARGRPKARQTGTKNWPASAGA